MRKIRWTMVFRGLMASMAVMLLACETDSYDKGQGRYSLLQADFAELEVNDRMQGIGFLTDEGQQYVFTQPITAQWIETADTTYRTIIYYNKVDDRQAEPMSIGQLATLRPIEAWRINYQPDDPIGLESCWLTRSGKYINLGLLVKSGYVDDQEGIHTVRLVQDTVLVNDDQTRTAYYRLLHDQGDAPLHYTNRRYLSILLPADRPDSVCLSLTTFEGKVEQRLRVKQ